MQKRTESAQVLPEAIEIKRRKKGQKKKKKGRGVGNTHNVDALISGNTDLGALSTKVNTHDTHGPRRCGRYVTREREIEGRGKEFGREKKGGSSKKRL